MKLMSIQQKYVVVPDDMAHNNIVLRKQWW